MSLLGEETKRKAFLEGLGSFEVNIEEGGEVGR